MLKIYFKKIFSFLKLLWIIEIINFQKQKYTYKRKNEQFKIENPSIKMPPDFYMYETFALDYHKIYFGGQETAKWIIDHFKNYLEFKNKKILDWGCGSGRVLRHLSSFVDKSNTIYGTDYNKKYTNWCKENIKDAHVVNNELTPPLNYKKDSFDAIYGISIVTHLSKKMHHLWFKELHRVLKKDGLLLLTTHGLCFKEKLTLKEQYSFDQGTLIEHKHKVEGNRLFATYQPPKFITRICIDKGFKIVKHIEGELKNKKPQQDVWILQKN